MAKRRQERGEDLRTRGRLGRAKKPKAEPGAELPPGDRALLKGLSAITQLAPTTASSLRVLHKGAPYYAALREDTEKAQRDVHVESFIWRDDEVGAEFLQLLTETARRGVAVRLLLDELGCYALRDRYFRPLVEAGGEFSLVPHPLPPPCANRYSFNLRNHRKLQIIDGKAAFVGGMNFGREYLGRDPKLGDWPTPSSGSRGRGGGPGADLRRGLVLRHGPGGAARAPRRAGGRRHRGAGPARRARRGRPRHAPRQPAAHGRGPEAALDLHRLLRPGETIQTALQAAAATGVDVRLLISSPEPASAPRLGGPLLLRRPVAPGGTASSNIPGGSIIRNSWSSTTAGPTVGSSNLDERSMRLNFELNLLAFDPRTNGELARLFQRRSGRRRRSTGRVFPRRPFSGSCSNRPLRPFSPIL